MKEEIEVELPLSVYIVDKSKLSFYDPIVGIDNDEFIQLSNEQKVLLPPSLLFQCLEDTHDGTVKVGDKEYFVRFL